MDDPTSVKLIATRQQADDEMRKMGYTHSYPFSAMELIGYWVDCSDELMMGPQGRMLMLPQNRMKTATVVRDRLHVRNATIYYDEANNFYTDLNNLT